MSEILDHVPPHARGWTRMSNEPLDAREVSPARAGMDRNIVAPLYCGRCFPRTRGDGPSKQTKPILDALFPPHARGWTASDPSCRAACCSPDP